LAIGDWRLAIGCSSALRDSGGIQRAVSRQIPEVAEDKPIANRQSLIAALIANRQSLHVC
jgi:hypothetical protein